MSNIMCMGKRYYPQKTVSGGTYSVAQEIGPDFQLLKIRTNLTFLHITFSCNIHDVFILFTDQLFELGFS